MWRKLETCEKPRRSRNWGDYKRVIEHIFVDYEKTKQQMVEELSEQFPEKVYSRVITRGELEDYLIDVMLRDFTGPT